MKFKQLREKYRSKYPSALVSAAVKIAIDMSGNMSGAYKKIEAMKKGLANDSMVKDALRQANESVKHLSSSHLTDALRQANESVNEGKYSAYSDLLLMKARIIDKEGPKSDKLAAVDSQIRIVMKRLGIKEDTEVKEGTWAIPSTIDKMKKFQGMLQKPMFAKNKGAVEKFKNTIYSLMGDDQLFDVYDRIIMDKEFNGQDMVELLVKSLEGRWFNFKKKGKGWVATHQYFGMEQPDDDVDEGKGRPTGYYKPKKKMKIESLKESFITKSPFKLKSKQYPRALAIETQGYGKRHAGEQDILEACDSFGMITEQELQIQQVEKTLGKKGFLTYNKTELADIFEDRETQRMILALESVTEVQLPTEYDRATITRALDEDTDVEFTKPDGMKAQGPVLKMSSNTYNLKDMHTGKSFTFKYIDEDKGVKTFGQVISEARFSSKLVKQAGGIAFDKRYVGGDMSGAIKAIEKLKKGLSDDPKVREILRYANESFNNKWYNAMSEDEKTDYQKFFSSALKKFGVNSPADLDDGKKKEFFNYVDKNYKAVDEQQFDEKAGKYSMYSDLLLQKQRFVAKGELKTPVLDKAIEKEKKKLGIKDSVNKVDGRIRPFKEKMTKLGYFKR